LGDPQLATLAQNDKVVCLWERCRPTAESKNLLKDSGTLGSIIEIFFVFL